MVVFDAADGKRYDATQAYFVTAECWEALAKHFARRQRKVQPAKKTKKSPQSQLRKSHAVASASKKRRSA
jgi:hypothetical protein